MSFVTAEEKQNNRPTSSMHYVHMLLSQLADTGGDPDDVLARVGIHRSELERSPGRISTEKLADLVQLSWQLLQDENLGLSRNPCKPGTFYWMGWVTIHQSTLEQAFNLGIRYYSHWVKDYDLSLSESGDKATFTVKLKYPELDTQGALTELVLMSWHRYGSWLIDQNIPLIDSYLAYPKPAHWDEYKYILPSQHHFDQEVSGFTFAAHYLKRDVVQPESGLDGFMSRCPTGLFLRHRGDQSFAKKVRVMLENALGKGPLPDLGAISETLSMAPETLRRKLKHEGTSYRRIKDLVRRDAAFYHLARRTIPANEIAELVGFSESSVFARAFKEWTGISPHEFRSRSQNKS